MLTVSPYLNFPGNTEEAMNYYKSIFGGEFTLFQRYGDIPGGDKMPENEQQKINHISLPVGNTTLMATDFLDFMNQKMEPGNNFHICIQAQSEKEVDKLFEGLSAGGKIEMPVNKTFWGAYFGMCRDKFGIQWMVNYSYNQTP